MYFDVELEKNLLGAILFSNELMDELRVKPIQIYNNKNRKCLEVMCSLHSENKEINYVTLAEALKGIWTITEIAYLTDNGSLYLGSFNSIQDKIISLYEKTATNNALVKGIEMLSEGKEPVHVLTVINDCFSKDIDDSTSSIKHISEFVEDALVTIENAYAGGSKITGMETGFKLLDDTLNGIEKGKYIIIGARPGVGKSAMALEMAKRLSRKNTVLVFSLEMQGEENAQRLLSNEARLPMMNVKRGNLMPESFSNLINKAAVLEKLNLSVDETEGLTIEELERRARRFRKSNGLDVIVIDYLTLLNAEAKFNGVREKVNYISTKIRQLAKSLNVAVIVLSQLKREAESNSNNDTPKPVTMADIRESGNIEQDAHVILLLQEKISVDPSNKDKLLVYVAKNRGGQKGETIEFNYYKRTQIIDEIN
ncbi:replicative DNA helicase [Clostridium sp. UBA1652]|uniref:replicative DNA helicase n=1 Tax=Clostridium sp. UBA1652 TaxID=1946348 RepID=UPI002580152F|nr:DnaB-like helicase C-terminal domain-containing protein [Clostridium sp. UBA1652]